MICGKQSKLVWLKGMYPYEYMNSFPRFKETKLPDKKKTLMYLNYLLADVLVRLFS